MGCGLNSPEVETKSALKHDKEVSASFYVIKLLIFCLGRLQEEADSAVAFICMLLDLILEQIEKGICS